MVANIRGYTPNYNFKLINFDTPRWHTLEYENWTSLDSVLHLGGIVPTRGYWLNDTLYFVDDLVIDPADSYIYKCLVEHTSPVGVSFAQARAASPTYWTLELEKGLTQDAFRWSFENLTSSSPPVTIGNVRFNNGSPTFTTAIFISSQSADNNNPDVHDWLMTWDDSTNVGSRGTIYVRKVGAPDQFLIFDVVGDITDNTTWLQIPVEYASHNGTLINGDPLSISFTRAGDQGPSGPGGGDLLSTNNLNDVQSAGASRTNLGVGNTDIVTHRQLLLTDPVTTTTQAATKEYADTKVPKIGNSTISGILTIGHNATDGTIYLGTSGSNNITSTAVGLFYTAKQIATQEWVTGQINAAVSSLTTQINAKVAKAGDTMTGTLSINGGGLNVQAGGINKAIINTDGSANFTSAIRVGGTNPVMYYTDGTWATLYATAQYTNASDTYRVSLGAGTHYAQLNNLGAWDVNILQFNHDPNSFLKNTGTQYSLQMHAGTAFYNDTGTGDWYLRSSGNVRMYVAAGGDFYAYGNAYKPVAGDWLSSSDARIKTVTGEYTRGWDDIKNIQPVVYTIDVIQTPEGAEHSDSPDKKHNIGLIAQQVEPYMPEMVSQRTATIDGNQIDDFRTLDTQPLLYALLNAVKELTARIEALESPSG